MTAPDMYRITKLNPKALKKLPQMTLEYGTAPSRFGTCLGAFTGNALAFLTFFEQEAPIDKLQKTFPKANLSENQRLIAPKLEQLFESDDDVEFCLKGTDFEMEVWEALLKIRKGTTCSYSDVAEAIGRPRAVRAAARAVARNNIAYFVPCHRVIKKDGSLHRYGGGPERKEMMLKDEGAI